MNKAWEFCQDVNVEVIINSDEAENIKRFYVAVDTTYLL